MEVLLIVGLIVVLAALAPLVGPAILAILGIAVIIFLIGAAVSCFGGGAEEALLVSSICETISSGDFVFNLNVV